MPTYAQPPIPDGLVGLVSLGLNQVKLALLVELARAGGRASTSDLLAGLRARGAAGDVPRATALRHLREMLEEGYVANEEPSREGIKSVWVLHESRLHYDLRALIADTTPAKERSQRPRQGQEHRPLR